MSMPDLPEPANMPNPFSTWRPHPWHGLGAGPEPPSLVNVFVEITPFDLIKYEVDKESGYLKVDRPQRTSSLPPSIYGFIPQTYCGPGVAKLMRGAERGDGDPLDICVISERPISRAEVLLRARVVGGLPMLDRGEADDKIVSILKDDPAFDAITEVGEIPGALIDRLVHYFSTYKLDGDPAHRVSVGAPYGREHAESVIRAALQDYRAEFKSEG